MVEMEGSDLHIATNTPPQVRVHGHLQRLPAARADAVGNQAAGLQRADRLAEEALRGDRWSSTSRSASRRSAPLPLQRLHPARRRRRGLPAHPREDPHLRRARPAAGAREPVRTAARPGPRHRSDRQRQVDDAGRDARQDQLGAPRAHPDHRGSDRVHPPAQELPREPARGPQRHQQLHQRAARGAARGSGHRPRSARCAISKRSNRR